jgi:hypothetical protein
MFEEEKQKIEEIGQSLKKKWYQSKTIIFNTIIIGLTALEANFHTVKEVFGINIFLYLSIAVPMVNFYLRMITTKAIDKDK